MMVPLLLAWLLITPPYGGPPWTASTGVGCGDAGHMNPCAPLDWWLRLGVFPDEAACRRGRDDGIVHARGDDEWSAYQIARCFTEERVRNGPRLLPGE